MWNFHCFDIYFFFFLDIFLSGNIATVLSFNFFGQFRDDVYVCVYKYFPVSLSS